MSFEPPMSFEFPMSSIPLGSPFRSERSKVLLNHIIQAVRKLNSFPLQCFSVGQFTFNFDRKYKTCENVLAVKCTIASLDQKELTVVYSNHGVGLPILTSDLTEDQLVELVQELDILDTEQPERKYSFKDNIDVTPIWHKGNSRRTGNNEMSLGANLRGNNDTNLGVNVSSVYNFCQFFNGKTTDLTSLASMLPNLINKFDQLGKMNTELFQNDKSKKKRSPEYVKDSPVVDTPVPTMQNGDIKDTNINQTFDKLFKKKLMDDLLTKPNVNDTVSTVPESKLPEETKLPKPNVNDTVSTVPESKLPEETKPVTEYELPKRHYQLGCCNPRAGLPRALPPMRSKPISDDPDAKSMEEPGLEKIPLTRQDQASNRPITEIDETARRMLDGMRSMFGTHFNLKPNQDKRSLDVEVEDVFEDDTLENTPVTPKVTPLTNFNSMPNDAPENTQETSL